ncbi:MAG TPA: hypothetical protein VFE47_05605 [Tepidisphaeraceae bacterium]|jgi:tetratricopeptide (TPR) repeat protein|nr:hypothetical protein [Tepidisphaeraceae bacterium]
MNGKPIYIVGRPRLIIFGLLGAVAGAVVAIASNPLPLTQRDRLIPAAYRVPKIPGGTALRLAMVHDILHERYLCHGTAWYSQRNKNAREILAKNAPVARAQPSGKYFGAMDDLAIGLQSLGKFDEAAAVMRKKLALLPPLPAEPATQPAEADTDPSGQTAEFLDQQKILAAQDLSPTEHHQYTACANLGTILVHGAMPAALGGNAAAREKVREGLTFIERAIAINPGAHFGRERWQAIAIEDLLAAMEHPDLLEKYDLIGQPLDHPISLNDRARPWRRRPEIPLEDADISPGLRLLIRSDIGVTGIDPQWAKIVHCDYDQPMPFDEPTLAIIGMWTLGGGPSPHFALTLAITMEALEQRAIAWNAYERAVELQDHFWPDPAVRQKMVDLCRARQATLATTEAPGDPSAWQKTMRDRHRRELAWGMAYQKAYQDYEAAQIAAGVPLDRADFYAAFFKGRPPIASPPGLADDFVLTQHEAVTLADMLPCMVLGFSLAMLAAFCTGTMLKLR